jgi:hypothetical protein
MAISPLKTITGQDQWSAGVAAPADPSEINPPLALSMVGLASTVTVQRSFDGGNTWRDLPTTYTGTQEVDAYSVRGVVYRIGVKTGDYVAPATGTVQIAI